MDKSALLKKAIVFQHDDKDCGAACLLTAVNWFGYTDSLEHIRVLTGTNAEGVTLLGLKQGANEIGFEAEAFKATIDELYECKNLCILHITKYDQIHHFVLCVGNENGFWLIADPEDGVKKYADHELQKVWDGRLLRIRHKKKLDLPKAGARIKRKWFLSLFNQHRRRLLLILVLGVLHACLMFNTSVFTERLVDELLPSNDKTTILFGVGLWALLLLVGLGLTYLKSHTTALFSRDFNASLIKRFFDKLLYLPKPFFESKKTGDLITRLEDAEEIEDSVTKWIEDGVVGFLVVMVAMGLLFVYDIEIALINLSLLPLLFLITLYQKRSVHISQREAMVSHAMNNANYVDVITGLDVIKSRQAEIRFGRNALDLYRNFRNKVFHTEKVGMNFGFLVQFSTILITMLVIGISCFKVLYGGLQMGNFLAIVSISSIASANTSHLAFAFIDFEQARISFERMYDLISQRTEDSEKEPPLMIKSRNELNLRNLAFSFPGRAPLLKDISLTLKTGRLVSLLGESGSGKSTLMDLMATLYAPVSGVIQFNGQDIDQSKMNWRRIIGVVPQETKVFNATYWENIAVKSIGERDGVAKRRVESLITSLGLQSFSDLPLGVDAVLGENGIKLSGGQKRILGLLRALYHRPKLLLLDEVTASLDWRGEELVGNILQKLKRETLILQITHNPSIAMQSDYLYLLQNGKTDVHGTPANLLSEGSVLNQFVKPFPSDDQFASMVKI